MKLIDARLGLCSAVLCLTALNGLAQSSVITTYVGPAVPISGTPALTQAIDFPVAVAPDGVGGFYVASVAQNRVYRVAADGMLTVIAAQAQLAGPSGLALDSGRNLYIADTRNHRVLRVTPNGVIATVAGTGTPGFSGDGGPAAAAQISSPNGVAVDAAGNLYIADADNKRVRKVTAEGVINTFAGSGGGGVGGDGGPATSAQLMTPYGVATDALGNVYVADGFAVRRVSADGIISTVVTSHMAGRFNQICTFSRDGGPATSAQLYSPFDVAVDVAGSVFIADSMNNRIRKASFFAAVQPYSIPNAGANYWTATSMSTAITIGSARVQTAQGSPPSHGVAVFSYRSNGVLISEASVPASAPVQTGRIYAESGGAVRTGLAIANPNEQGVSISFYFTDKDGVSFNSGTMTLGSRQQFAAFLDEAPFRGPATARSFTFMSSLPVGAIALRGFVNERGEFLMTTLPVALISSTANTAITLPHFAAGGGWTTQILLVNPTEESISESVDMDGATTYSIAPRSATRIGSSTSGLSIRAGAVRITPATGSRSPVASSVFTFISRGITVTESGVATSGTAQSFRILAEVDSARSLQTGIAIANAASTTATIQFDLLDMTGQQSGYSGSVTVNGNGHLAVFLNEIPGLHNVPRSFRGVLRVSSNTLIAAIGLRERYNERGDFVVSATPAIAENTPATTDQLVFPHVVAGGGYTTEFILMSSGGASEGTVILTSQSGAELPLQLLR